MVEETKAMADFVAYVTAKGCVPGTMGAVRNAQSTTNGE
jgi:hypothetical protein